MKTTSEAEKLKVLLSNIHKKGYNGASLQEVMHELKNELPKIVNQIDLAK